MGAFQVKRTQILALALALSLAGAGQGSFLPGLGADAWARDVAAEPLTVRVVVRPYLYLEIGSPGGIVDTVNFTVAGLPGSGPVPGQSTGANPVPVWAEGLVRSATTVMLTADSSRPLEDGSNNQIPFPILLARQRRRALGALYGQSPASDSAANYRQRLFSPHGRDGLFL